MRRLLPLVLFLASPALGEDLDFGRVPSFAARDLDEKRIVLEELTAEGPVVLTFWATWCKPCRKELPELQKLLKRHGERGLRVVAVSVDGPVDQAKVRPFVRSQGFDFIVVPDLDGEIRRRLQVEVVPTTFLLEGEGRILHRQVGYRQGDEKALEAALLESLEIRDEGAPDP